MREQQRLVDELTKIDPNYVPPATVKREKPMRKVLIPVEEYPNYNFIGIIIGPRGVTQKDLEGKTGAKIAIRGKGSVKDGGKSSRRDVTREQDNEPLHVLLTADTETQLDEAEKMIQVPPYAHSYPLPLCTAGSWL
jgi:splicing factor 1